MGDQRARELNRRRDQEPVGRIAMLELIQAIAAGSRTVGERYGLDTWTFEKSRNPRLDRQVQLDPPGIDE